MFQVETLKYKFKKRIEWNKHDHSFFNLQPFEKKNLFLKVK